MTIQDTLPHVQAVRRVYDNGHSTTSPNTAEVFHLPCHLDPFLNKDILLWDDIVSAFKGDIVHIRSGTMILPYLKGPDFKNLEPLRIATLPGVTLDVVIQGRPEEKELSLESLQKALPGANQQGDRNKATPAFNTSAVATARQNPAGGLVEAAWDNYTHIDNPDAGPARRGPQAIHDNQGASNSNNESNSNININTSAKEPKTSSTCASLARLPQSTSVAAQDITEIMMNARMGDMHAQNALGEMYEYGRGVHQHNEAAMDWYLKAAEQGLASAQFNVGYMYAYGRGVPQDYTKVMVWFRKSAAQDYAPAQSALGHLYRSGQGVLRDFHEAMKWYIKAAEQGNAAAQNNIGIMYQAGHGVPQDYSTAMDWYLKAADQGFAASQNNTGWMYQNGYGVPRDYFQAMSWYRKAADQGHATAQTNVAWIYEQGLGVPKDKAKAIEWYRKAVAGGDAGAKVALDRRYQRQ